AARQDLLAFDDALRLRDVAADGALEDGPVALRPQNLYRLCVRVAGDVKGTVVAVGVACGQETHGRKRAGPRGDSDEPLARRADDRVELFHVTSVAGCRSEDSAETSAVKPTDRGLRRVATGLSPFCAPPLRWICAHWFARQPGRPTGIRRGGGRRGSADLPGQPAELEETQASGRRGPAPRIAHSDLRPRAISDQRGVGQQPGPHSVPQDPAGHV